MKKGWKIKELYFFSQDNVNSTMCYRTRTQCLFMAMPLHLYNNRVKHNSRVDVGCFNESQLYNKITVCYLTTVATLSRFYISDDLLFIPGPLPEASEIGLSPH